MATEAPNHSQQNGTTNVNADLIVGVVCGGIFFLGIVAFIIIRCLAKRREKQIKERERDVADMELGVLHKSNPHIPWNVPNRRTDEIKTRDISWEDQLRFYRTRQEERESRVASENPRFSRLRSLSQDAIPRFEADIIDARRWLRQDPTGPSSDLAIHDRSRPRDGHTLEAQGMPIIKVPANLRPVKVRVGIDHIPRHATIVDA